MKTPAKKCSKWRSGKTGFTSPSKKWPNAPIRSPRSWPRQWSTGGVRRVFGMVGHSNLGLADALRGQEEQGALTYIGVRHEGAASFACSGYAKISGRSAACLTIAGPGATNLLTGLWDAKVDRAPGLALTGQVDVQVLGPDMFQDIDLASAFQAVTRFSQTVYSGSNHAELMALACKNAIVNRDVAHLIFPDDVQTIPCPNPASASGLDGRLGDDAITPSEASLAKALSLIAGASRPIIIAGYGAKMGMDKVIALAEKLGAPVVTTFKGKGQMSDAHPLFGGNLGHSGTPVASWFMNESDLILVFGASFSNHTGIDKSKPIIQVDFDQMMLGKTQPVAAPVWGGDRHHRSHPDRTVGRRHHSSRPKRRDRRTLGDLACGKGKSRQRRQWPWCQFGCDFCLNEPDVARGCRHRSGRWQQYLLLWPLFRMHPPINLDVRLFGVDRVRVSRGPWRMVGDPRFPRIERPQGGFGQRRRWVRSVPGGFHHRCHVRHGHHPHPFEQQ